MSKYTYFPQSTQVSPAFFTSERAKNIPWISLRKRQPRKKRLHRRGAVPFPAGDSGIPGYKGSIPLLLLYDRKSRFVRGFVGWGEGSLSSVRAAVEEVL